MENLKELRRSTGAALCVECGKCTSMCPLAFFGGFSAARTLSMHDPESEIHRYANAVERCLTCASCEVRCPQGVRYTDYVVASGTGSRIVTYLELPFVVETGEPVESELVEEMRGFLLSGYSQQMDRLTQMADEAAEELTLA